MTSLFDEFPEDNAPFLDGDRLRDLALDRLRKSRSALIRRLTRAFLQHLIDHGPDTSDAVRDLVPIPAGVDPRVVGAAVHSLAKSHLINSIGRRKSSRCVAHARKLDLWAVADLDSARLWLLTHPDLESADAVEVVRG
jgi:hypothetical protein